MSETDEEKCLVETCRLTKLKPDSFKPLVNSNIFSEATKHQVANIFRNIAVKKSKADNTPDGRIETENFPFPYGFIENFLTNRGDGSPATSFVMELHEQLLSLEFIEKSNDLYKFKQTNELMSQTSEIDNDVTRRAPLLKQFCGLLRSVVLPWLREQTGIELNDEINMFSAQYASTDCLLCHDDELEHRRIAYVYYLTPDWSRDDGGSLDLFDSVIAGKGDTGDFYEPGKIVKSLVPNMNSFVFFEVSSKSFHQVSEVVSKNKVRLSLSGWFHGPLLPRPSRPRDPKPPISHFTSSTSDDSPLPDWINPMYLSLATQGGVQEQFIEDSEIQLNDFLLTSKYQSLYEAIALLSDHQEAWETCGPPIRRRYRKLLLSEPEAKNLASNKLAENDSKLDAAISLVQECIQVFLSEDMFLFLSNLTGLSFHPMAANSDDSSDDDVNDDVPAKRQRQEAQNVAAGIESGCRYQVRHWRHGDYTLLRDVDSEKGEYALDVNLFLCEKDWKEEYGGYTSYIASDEAEELLTIVPAKNCLSLVYRDHEALRFVKHVNYTSPCTVYDVALSYYQ